MHKENLKMLNTCEFLNFSKINYNKLDYQINIFVNLHSNNKIKTGFN